MVMVGGVGLCVGPWEGVGLLRVWWEVGSQLCLSQLGCSMQFPVASLGPIWYGLGPAWPSPAQCGFSCRVRDCMARHQTSPSRAQLWFMGPICKARIHTVWHGASPAQLVQSVLCYVGTMWCSLEPAQFGSSHPGSTQFPTAKLGPTQHSTEAMGGAGLALCYSMWSPALQLAVPCWAVGQQSCSASLASSCSCHCFCLCGWVSRKLQQGAPAQHVEFRLQIPATFHPL